MARRLLLEKFNPSYFVDGYPIWENKSGEQIFPKSYDGIHFYHLQRNYVNSAGYIYAPYIPMRDFRLIQEAEATFPFTCDS